MMKHATSLRTDTIAILGGGIDHIHPAHHDRLYVALAADGFITSDSPFGHETTGL